MHYQMTGVDSARECYGSIHVPGNWMLISACVSGCRWWTLISSRTVCVPCRPCVLALAWLAWLAWGSTKECPHYHRLHRHSPARPARRSSLLFVPRLHPVIVSVRSIAVLGPVLAKSTWNEASSILISSCSPSPPSSRSFFNALTVHHHHHHHHTTSLLHGLSTSVTRFLFSLAFCFLFREQSS